jgi:hypothetical protein
MPLALRYGKIARMAERPPGPKSLLREDLSKEYYALLGVVSSYDGWLLIVKGWSVTLSLAALGLGFQQRHYALFFLAAVTGAAFWYLDGLMKGFQYRYYVRMREIEYTAYLINAVPLGGKYRHSKISAPRIDMTWGFKGYPINTETGKPLPRHRPWWRGKLKLGPEDKPWLDWRGPKPKQWYDWRDEEPERRPPEKIRRDLRHRFRWANVALPHVLAVLLGLGLFIAALAKAPWLGPLHP